MRKGGVDYHIAVRIGIFPANDGTVKWEYCICAVIPGYAAEGID